MRRLCSFISTLLLILTLSSCGNDTEEKQNPNEFPNEGYVGQSYEILGNVSRRKPVEQNEGLARYPVYNQSFSATEEEKQAILAENKYLVSSSETYNSMDKDGKLFLDGVSTGRKLYKHTAANMMYGGNISDSEPAVSKKITIKPRNLGNYITGLYAAPGEVIKVEISEEDLAKSGGFKIEIGNVANRGGGNTIPIDKAFNRMPNLINTMKVSDTTVYVGSFLGGPIYLGEPAKKNESYSVTISGAVEYRHFILGQTTAEQDERLRSSTAPYFDLEVWDDAIRHSGPASTVTDLDFSQLYDAATLWEKISVISNKVPSASANVGISMRYDTYIPAGAAVAFVGANYCVLPISWMNNALNYESIVSGGMWGAIHEYNHHYQAYGMPNGGEVCNNAVSLISYALYTNISANRSIDDSSLGNGWNRFTDASRALRETLSSTSANYTLAPYATLLHCFGADIFLKAISLQKEKSSVDGWYLAFSKAANYDLTYFFESICKLPLSAAAKEEIKGLNFTPFVPVASTFQTKANYVEDSKQMMRPYVVSNESTIIDLNNYLIVPEGFTYNVVSISKPSSGTLEKTASNNVYTYKPAKDTQQSGAMDVVIALSKKDGAFSVPNVTLSIEFTVDEVLTEGTTYQYDADTMYRNIPVAEANAFANEQISTDFTSSTLKLENLPANSITTSSGKFIFETSGKYRFYIRGKEQISLYLSFDKGKTYTLAAHQTATTGSFSNDKDNSYYDFEYKAFEEVYYKQVVLTKTNGGWFEIGYGVWKNEEVSAKTIPNKYLYHVSKTTPKDKFSTPNYYPKKYSNTGSILDVRKQSIINVENYKPWNNDYPAENILNGNKNSILHSNHKVSTETPFILTVDLGSIEMANYLTIYGKNANESHVPISFDLYVGTTLENMKLYRSAIDLTPNTRSVTLKFDETVSFRYYRLVVKDTSTHKYIAIGQIDFGLLVEDGRNISMDNEFITYEGSWRTSTNLLSFFGHTTSSKTGSLSYIFEGNTFAIHGMQMTSNSTFEISIDNSEWEKISVFTGVEENNFIYFNNNLENTTHTVKIRMKSGNIEFNYFVIA